MGFPLPSLSFLPEVLGDILHIKEHKNILVEIKALKYKTLGAMDLPYCSAETHSCVLGEHSTHILCYMFPGVQADCWESRGSGKIKLPQVGHRKAHVTRFSNGIHNAVSNICAKMYLFPERVTYAKIQ